MFRPSGGHLQVVEFSLQVLEFVDVALTPVRASVEFSLQVLEFVDVALKTLQPEDGHLMAETCSCYY
jgi:hypothetical protein